MKKLIILGISALAFATTADAACTKKSLNGNWQIGVFTTTGSGVLSGGNFSASISGTPVSFALTSFNSTKCKGTGTGSISWTPMTVTIASEAIPGGSAKPNHLIVTFASGGMFTQLVMQRL